MTPSEYAKKKMLLANKVKDAWRRYCKAMKEYDYFVSKKTKQENIANLRKVMKK
jgi:hypothetical protein